MFLNGSISSLSYLICFTFCRKNGGPSWSGLGEAVLSFFTFSPSWMYICNLYESIYGSCSIILLAQECPTHSPALISDAGGPYDFGNIWGYFGVLMLFVCMPSRNLWTCDCRIVVDFKIGFHLQPPWVFVSHGMWLTGILKSNSLAYPDFWCWWALWLWMHLMSLFHCALTFLHGLNEN